MRYVTGVGLCVGMTSRQNLMRRVHCFEKINSQQEVIDMKRLYKSRNNQVLDGVCGGIAEYLNIDPTLVRLAWIAFSFFAGSGLIAYIVAACIIPRAPKFEDPIPHEPMRHDAPPNDWSNHN